MFGFFIKESLTQFILDQISLCFSLLKKLANFVTRGTKTWVLMFVRLLIFVIILTPGWINLMIYWIVDKRIMKNIEYGKGYKYRNVLDVYLPDVNAKSDKRPIIIFVGGGAWIIGYKFWSALIAKSLSRYGFVVIVPDYRNFPQGDIDDMCDDVELAIRWTMTNADSLGADASALVLAGQSAGAHICLCTLVKLYEREISISHRTERSDSETFFPPSTPEAVGVATQELCEKTLLVDAFIVPVDFDTSQLIAISSSYDSIGEDGSVTGNTWRSVQSLDNLNDNNDQECSSAPLSGSLLLPSILLFVGVSGPYDLLAMQRHLHHRGLDASVIEWLSKGDVSAYSPTQRLSKLVERFGADSLQTFPPVALFHGAIDASIPFTVSEGLYGVLAGGGNVCSLKVYQGCTHTDPILEGPLTGDDRLARDVSRTIAEIQGRDGVLVEMEAVKGARMFSPRWLTNVARFVNPF